MSYALGNPVPLYQHDSEFEALLDIYRDHQPRRVLEIGSYHGGSLYHWLRNAPPGAHVVSVDTYTAADNRDQYPEWIPEGVELTVIQGDSADPAIVAAVARLGPYDWIFIDAGHLLPEVTADWENYRPLTADGGIVAFHDILPPNEYHPEIQVAPLWDEIKAEYPRTGEIVQNRYAPWGGIGVVRL